MGFWRPNPRDDLRLQPTLTNMKSNDQLPSSASMNRFNSGLLWPFRLLGRACFPVEPSARRSSYRDVDHDPAQFGHPPSLIPHMLLIILCPSPVHRISRSPNEVGNGQPHPGDSLGNSGQPFPREIGRQHAPPARLPREI